MPENATLAILLAMKRAWIVLAACAVLAGGVCADQLHLKDGSIINGTIVGFDESSFKVKTNYGYAMVRRDQVVSIDVTDTDSGAVKKPDPNAKPGAPATAAPAGSNFPSANAAPAAAPANKQLAPAATPPAARPRSTGDPAAATIVPPNLKTSGPPNTVASKSTPPPAAITPTKTMMTPPAKPAPTSSTAAAKPPVIAASAPVPAVVPASAAPPIPKPVPPEPIRESISGNLYTNDTYGFRMFRPPGWEIIEDARTTLPGAIAALGTNDQTTYLLIGASPSAGSLDADLKASDVKLKEMVENFRPLGDKKSTVAGLPAIERRFRGAVDGKDWSGTVVLVQRGKQLYTIFGMTYAGTDLVQIQENVIHRAITSLQFTK
ncbi:MAG: hypothetical protein WCB14_11165 [Candidatus Acidiferrales bacterium]